VRTDPRDREILRLAVPAFLALVAEPLFLLADAAIVGHLGTAPLAALGIAAVVLQTVVGLCVFLAYGTTAGVARHLGAGDLRGALAHGVDGLWLAGAIGALVTGAGVLLAGPLVRLFGASDVVADPATTYLRIAFLGVIPLLLMLAATGVLRGLQDTRTPLLVAVGGNALNVALNLVLVYPAGLGLAGSALGSVLAQSRARPRSSRSWCAPPGPRGGPGARSAGHPRRGPRGRAPGDPHPDPAGRVPRHDVRRHRGRRRSPRPGDRPGDPPAGVDDLGFLAFALDAIAIAAQAITGRALGAGDVGGTRALTPGWSAGAP